MGDGRCGIGGATKVIESGSELVVTGAEKSVGCVVQVYFNVAISRWRSDIYMPLNYSELKQFYLLIDR